MKWMIASDIHGSLPAAERMRARYEEAGISVYAVNFAYSSHFTLNNRSQKADDNIDGFDTATLYRSAKIFLKTLGEA